jgi:hypothetical protein
MSWRPWIVAAVVGLVVVVLADWVSPASGGAAEPLAAEVDASGPFGRIGPVAIGAVGPIGPTLTITGRPVDGSAEGEGDLADFTGIPRTQAITAPIGGIGPAVGAGPQNANGSAIGGVPVGGSR